MFKLLIIDDEEIICQTIANLIDWKSLGISLIGTCLDGVEAYHMILDESPDIVMTDIRMPGISGLELIERITATDLHTQFIILSGYGEFDYAKRAMKCGVKHYLLKPCDEQQIISCMQDVIKDIQEQILSENASQNPNMEIQNLRETLINNIFLCRKSLLPFLNLTNIISICRIPLIRCVLFIFLKSPICHRLLPP